MYHNGSLFLFLSLFPLPSSPSPSPFFSRLLASPLLPCPLLHLLRSVCLLSFSLRYFNDILTSKTKERPITKHLSKNSTPPMCSPTRSPLDATIQPTTCLFARMLLPNFANSTETLTFPNQLLRGHRNCKQKIRQRLPGARTALKLHPLRNVIKVTSKKNARRPTNVCSACRLCSSIRNADDANDSSNNFTHSSCINFTCDTSRAISLHIGHWPRQGKRGISHEHAERQQNQT